MNEFEKKIGKWNGINKIWKMEPLKINLENGIQKIKYEKMNFEEWKMKRIKFILGNGTKLVSPLFQLSF